jgi:peptide deformylase
VGVLRRVVVIDIGEGIKNYINPEIIDAKGSREVVESCLSVPGRYGKIERPLTVTVKATDENGEEFTVTADELLADCLCHEIDHLDGILFIDKVTEFVDP